MPRVKLKRTFPSDRYDRTTCIYNIRGQHLGSVLFQRMEIVVKPALGMVWYGNGLGHPFGFGHPEIHSFPCSYLQKFRILQFYGFKELAVIRVFERGRLMANLHMYSKAFWDCKKVGLIFLKCTPMCSVHARFDVYFNVQRLRQF